MRIVLEERATQGDLGKARLQSPFNFQPRLPLERYAPSIPLLSLVHRALIPVLHSSRYVKCIMEVSSSLNELPDLDVS